MPQAAASTCDAQGSLWPEGGRAAGRPSEPLPPTAVYVDVPALPGRCLELLPHDLQANGNSATVLDGSVSLVLLAGGVGKRMGVRLLPAATCALHAPHASIRPACFVPSALLQLHEGFGWPSVEGAAVPPFQPLARRPPSPSSTSICGASPSPPTACKCSRRCPRCCCLHSHAVHPPATGPACIAIAVGNLPNELRGAWFHLPTRPCLTPAGLAVWSSLAGWRGCGGV